MTMHFDRPIAVILDTDIGDNVDDALALALACRSPELKLLGVTTVYRDPWRRAGMAGAVLEACGSLDVPVAAGIGKPLMRSWDRSPPRHYEVGYSHHIERLDRRHAVQFLIETAWTAPEPIAAMPLETQLDRPVRELFVPVTICCIGPLTNLAVAFATEPTLAERIRVVLMGGMISGEQPETNISADPEAAQIVFASGAEIAMVGLDVTLQCALTAEQVEPIKACERPHTRLLGRMIDSWMADSHRLPVLHDALAVAMCFDPSLCTLQPTAVEIETAVDHPGALTVAHPTAGSRTKVCTTVDRDRFVKLFLDRVHPARGWTLFELLIVISIILLLAGLLLPAIQMTRERARRMACANNLFQIGLSLNNYHDAHRTFPPGYVSAVGPAGEDLGPGWGWAAMLLPYLDYSHLSNSIVYEQGIDAPVNTTATGAAIEVFMCPSGRGSGKYAACFGRGDLFQTVDRGDGVFFRNSRVRLKDIDDGPVTILIGESATAHWSGVSALPPDAKKIGLVLTFANRARVLAHTGPIGAGQPVHMPNDPAGCAADFTSMHTGGAQFLFVDGSVRFLNQHIDSGAYAALATRAGGEVLSTTEF